jgi:hypothetical protein
VESPANPSRDYQREKRELTSMESPGKLCEVKDLGKRLTEKRHTRKIDSMFLDNGAKNVIAQSILSQSLKASRPRLA